MRRAALALASLAALPAVACCSDIFDDQEKPATRDDEGRYVSVDGQTVRAWFQYRRMHGDIFGRPVRYYVDSCVIRRNGIPEPDDDSRDGELLECR